MNNKDFVYWHKDEVKDWEKLIKELVEERDKKLKEEVIKASEFLPLITNDYDENKDLDEIERYYQKKIIYPNVIDPKLMRCLSKGGMTHTRREEYVKNWINEQMFDKSVWQIAREIDESFISEICKKEDYAINRIVIKKKEVFEKGENISSCISEVVNNIGMDSKDLILIIELKPSIKFLFSSSNKMPKKEFGKVINKYSLPNNFQFVIISKFDLVFHWIFWGLKWNYNIFNLTTYMLLHVWYRTRLKDKEEPNLFACLLEEQ